MKKDNFTLLKDEIKNTIEKRDSALLKQYNKKVNKNDKVKNIDGAKNACYRCFLFVATNSSNEHPP